MKRFSLRLSLLTILICAASLPASATTIVKKDAYTVFDKTIFYDGYLTDNIVDKDKDDDILRFSNAIASRKLDKRIIANIDNTSLSVTIGALCDNYDRMGRICLVMTPVGADSYNYESVNRIEIARFITPFMNKNKTPNEVSYSYNINDIGEIFRDKYILKNNDLWLETEVFGVPYDANKRISGCAGRNDVFSATVVFYYYGQHQAAEDQKIHCVPITVSKPEIRGPVNFNNYRIEATDTLGVSTRTYKYNVPEKLDDAEIVMIMTNHGAEEGGEEYERRKHLVYLDGEISYVYTPGGVSCEPYRKYNTQANALFDKQRDDEFWQEISNWCPGQAVPTRRIHLGTMEPGEHEIMIRVPDAEFYGADGDFRPSLFLLGAINKKLPVYNNYDADASAVESIAADEAMITFRREGDTLHFVGAEPFKEVCVYTFDGRLIEGHFNPAGSISLADYPAGQYIVVVTTHSGKTSFSKLVK